MEHGDSVTHGMQKGDSQHQDGTAELTFVADGTRYRCSLICEPMVRPPVHIVRSGCCSFLITLPGLASIVRSSHSFVALHSALVARGIELLPDPSVFATWCPDVVQVQCYFNALLSMPDTRTEVERFIKVESVAAAAPAPSKKRPLLLVGGIAHTDGASPRRAEVTVMIHQPGTPCPQGVAFVRWASAEGWTYPHRAWELGQVATAASLRWGGGLRMRLSRCYQEAWRRPKPRKRKATLLQSGCVLLRNALDAAAQQELIDTCFHFGHGEAGFFTPTYATADAGGGEAAMRLQMFCLGKHWDHRERRYSAVRTHVDGKTVPSIPAELVALAAEAAADANAAELKAAIDARKGSASQGMVPTDHTLLAEPPPNRQHGGGVDNGDSSASGGGDDDDDEDDAQGGENLDGCVCATAAPFTPDVAVVNLYGKAGNLGLHQDRDESAESLADGAPIVSVSLGDACVFVVGPPTTTLGGAPPHPAHCQFVRLYSGDIIVFSGESRLMWHGVKTVLANSAPRYLRLPQRPCRLNLTFRRF